MAPSVGNPPATTFSSTSLTAMNSYLFSSGGASCFSSCNATLPIAEFNASPQGVCSGTSIIYTDYSAGLATSRSWSFPGGSPSSSTAASQSVSYATTGVKTASLTATNSVGSSTISKTVFIGTAPGTACAANAAGDTAKPVFLGFSVAGIHSNSNFFYLNGFYHDSTCAQNTLFSAGATYVARVQVGILQSPYNYTGKAFLFLDYNNDGDFLDPNETLSLAPNCAQGQDTIIFTTLASPPVSNAWLRMRLVVTSCYAASSTNGCSLPSNAQTEDYGVYFSSQIPLPLSLLSFYGSHEEGRNLLSWQVTDNARTEYYEVERGVSGTEFAALGKVYNNPSAHSYKFADKLSSAGKERLLYYRLKITDQDGGYRYSNTLLLSNDGAYLPLSFYPNPVHPGEALHIQTQGIAPVRLTIINSLGQAVYAGQVPAGVYALHIPDTWPAGVYLLRVTGEQGTMTRTFAVQ
jgi:PKD repeat protein